MWQLLKRTPVALEGSSLFSTSSTKDVLAFISKAWRVQRDLQNASPQGHTSRMQVLKDILPDIPITYVRISRFPTKSVTLVL